MAGVGRAHPVGGVDYPRTFRQLLAWFPDDTACLDYLAGLRWPDGFVCPVCASSRYWRTAKARWMCVECGRQTSVTAGTIFHRTRTPLSMWFAAVWFMTSQTNGVSALGLQRVLGFGSYEPACAWRRTPPAGAVRPGLPPRVLRGSDLHRARPRQPPGRAPGRLAAEALAHRHLALRRLPGAPGLLPGRVHLPLQPPHLQSPRPAVLPATPTSRRDRPPSPERPAHATTRP